MIRNMILALLLILSSASLPAQERVSLESLFTQNLGILKGENVTQVHLSGSKIASYKLTLFKSLTLKPTKETYQFIESLVEAEIEAEKATCHEMSRKNDQLYHGLYQLPSKEKGIHRYIFYRNNALTEKSDSLLTLIYMEGSATIQQLQKTFRKP